MPAAEEVALFDRIGALIRGEDDRFDLIVFDTAPTGHTLRLIQMPELMEAWIRALSRSRRAMLGVEQDDKNDPIMMSLAERLERLREFRARLISPRDHAVRAGARSPSGCRSRRPRGRSRTLDDAGVRVGGLIVNRVLPTPRADPFLRARRAQEQVYLDEIAPRFEHRRPCLPCRSSERDVHGSHGWTHDRRQSARTRQGEPAVTWPSCRPTAAEVQQSATVSRRLHRQGAGDGPLAALEAQRQGLRRWPQCPSDERGTHRYAEGKWSVKRMLGHMADAERVFAYRLLRIARGDTDAARRLRREPVGSRTAASAAADGRRRRRVLRGSRATLALMRSMTPRPPPAWASPTAPQITARAIGWIIAGHVVHHVEILHERYALPDLAAGG